MLEINFKNIMAEAIGEIHGITGEDENRFEKNKKHVIKSFNDKKQMGGFPFMDLPFHSGEIPEIQTYARKNRGKFKNFVIIGIGGSALGNICLLNALKPLYYNYIPDEERNGPRVFIPDNIDPDLISELFSVLKPEETLCNIITKSGSTAETMANFLVVKRWLSSQLGEKYKDHLVFTTDRKNGDLRKIADKEGITAFSIPENIGGRFSVLTPVGMVMAEIIGIDTKKLFLGAKNMVNRVLGEIDDIALKTAFNLYILEKQKKKNILVMLPYSNHLERFADWFRQLWAESLGKQKDNDGNIVHSGQTPVKALGATDQHSQIQLYNEGPNDKIIAFIKVNNFNNDLVIPDEFEEYSATGYLVDHSLGELINTELKATEIALSKFHRPNFRMEIDKVDEESLGELIMFWEIVTVYMGDFYKINPFNQPGVEEGKKATYHLLKRPGYEDYKI